MCSRSNQRLLSAVLLGVLLVILFRVVSSGPIHAQVVGTGGIPRLQAYFLQDVPGGGQLNP